MITLYTAGTPNGHKISIALEELGLPYEAKKVNLREGEQFAAEFLRISPNNKIPAITDGELSIFESGAILVYLAEKTGKLLAPAGPARYAALQWLFFQVGNTGPMLGQVHHFRNYAPEKIPYAIERYTNEGKRLYAVVDRRLSEAKYLAGDAYTIADIANLTWLRLHANQGIALDEYPHLARWKTELEARPAVQRGLAVPPSTNAPMDERAREALFGKKQYERR
ncbi:MAG TPA: glutathione binding-like protein [Polyangiaceae bacterium]